MSFWDINSLDLHKQITQIEKQKGLSSLKYVEKFNRKNSIFQIDDDGEILTTTLDNCSCSDFLSDGKPCKHMYFLAKSMKKFKTNDGTRSSKLIADFSSGYAKDWFFTVRPANYLALDILNLPTRKTDKITKKKDTIFELKQGKFYNFTTCSVFYDNKLAHETVWSEALNHFKYSIQIQETIPSNKIYEFEFKNNMVIRNIRIIYGSVTFNLYTPNKEKTKEEYINTFTCYQDEFITFLKTGILKNKLNLQEDIINDR